MSATIELDNGDRYVNDGGVVTGPDQRICLLFEEICSIRPRTRSVMDENAELEGFRFIVKELGMCKIVDYDEPPAEPEPFSSQKS